MIIVLTNPKHGYTVSNLVAQKAVHVRNMGYHRVLRARSLPCATYIFSDLDRLNFWELELAARLYKTLHAAGLRVLNNPARVRLRFSLLRGLSAAGINQFNAWRVEDYERPSLSEYPVFLRTESAHRGNLTDLLHTPEEVNQAIEQALEAGSPLRDLILIQYCAEPEHEGYFCKHATFRVGDRMISTLPVHESGWSAKYGELGLVDSKRYAAQFESLRANEFGLPLKPAFDVAGIEFGRADFGVVNGSPQVYEINSNPMIGRRDLDHSDSSRRASAALFFDRLIEGLKDIDSPAGGPRVAVNDEKLVLQRRMDRYLLRPRWTP